MADSTCMYHSMLYFITEKNIEETIFYRVCQDETGCLIIAAKVYETLFSNANTRADV